MNTNVAVPSPTDSSQLPVRYEAARKALAECDAIDEVKLMADKAAALAIYARQAKDSSLHMMALRIQARAQRRMGEIIKQHPRGDESTRFGHAETIYSARESAGKAGTDPPVTRRELATNAGLSERQQKTALRIANIPVEAFEKQIESPRPPSITALAEQGVSKRASESEQDDREPAEHIFAALHRFTRFCDQTDAQTAARAFDATEAAGLRRMVTAVDRWLDAFVTRLSQD